MLKEIAAEKICLDRLMSLNPLMNVITISKAIERVEIEDHYYSDEEGHHDEDKQSGTSMGPHIWLAPSNVQKMAEQFLENSMAIISENSETFQV